MEVLGGNYMDIDKMVKEIKKDFKNKCEKCTYKDKYCGYELCTLGIKEWLELNLDDKEWFNESQIEN